MFPKRSLKDAGRGGGSNSETRGSYTEATGSNAVATGSNAEARGSDAEARGGLQLGEAVIQCVRPGRDSARLCGRHLHKSACGGVCRIMVSPRMCGW
jgi:hypothetical protein